MGTVVYTDSLSSQSIPYNIGQVHLNLPLCEFDFLNAHVHIRLGSARTQPSMTVICLTFWQNCRNVVSLEDKYLDCSPFGEDSIFLSVPKMGDGIVLLMWQQGLWSVSCRYIVGTYSTFSAVQSGIERNIWWLIFRLLWCKMLFIAYAIDKLCVIHICDTVMYCYMV